MNKQDREDLNTVVQFLLSMGRKRKPRKFIDDSTRKAKRALYLKAKDAPCTDCGTTYPPECMDFDHLSDDKIENVSRMVYGSYSLAALTSEINKCELVCANCHRIRTSARAQSKK